MLEKKLKDTFHIHYLHLVGPRDSGVRLIRGKQTLAKTIRHYLGTLSEDSKEMMRVILEGSDDQIADLFNFVSPQALLVYSAQRSLRPIAIIPIKSEFSGQEE